MRLAAFGRLTVTGMKMRFVNDFKLQRSEPIGQFIANFFSYEHATFLRVTIQSASLADISLVCKPTILQALAQTI